MCQMLGPIAANRRTWLLQDVLQAGVTLHNNSDSMFNIATTPFGSVCRTRLSLVALESTPTTFYTQLCPPND